MTGDERQQQQWASTPWTLDPCGPSSPELSFTGKCNHCLALMDSVGLGLLFDKDRWSPTPQNPICPQPRFLTDWRPSWLLNILKSSNRHQTRFVFDMELISLRLHPRFRNEDNSRNEVAFWFSQTWTALRLNTKLKSMAWSDTGCFSSALPAVGWSFHLSLHTELCPINRIKWCANCWRHSVNWQTQSPIERALPMWQDTGVKHPTQNRRIEHILYVYALIVYLHEF